VGVEELRQRIDDIDRKLVELLNDRAAAALEIGQLKSTGNMPVYAPHREAEIVRQIRAGNPGPLPNSSIEAIYREIISCMRGLEKVPRVVYLGPPGTFTNQAARDRFGTCVDYSPAETIESVFIAVSKHQADLGVVPIENSMGGGVIETLDMFMEYDLKICDEIVLAIHQNLLGKCQLEEVKKVCSKPEALTQCRVWLGEHLPHVEILPVASTAIAAKTAAQEPNTAAVASREAAELYELDVLAENIEDHHDNVTRFVVLSRHLCGRTGRDRTAIMFAVKNEVGALYQMLSPFKKAKINMTKIESRPSRTKAWDYCFFVDFLGHAEDPPVKKALEELEKQCRHLQILGSFPASDS
jgi:chorismate mutase/prephenate dehydratase